MGTALQKVKGIVLHVIKYSDSSNIVDVYTEHSGRMSFLASATRSKRSAVKAVIFQPLSIIEFEVGARQGNRLCRIKEARACSPFSSLPYDAHKTAIALFLAEFLYRAVREETENRPLFAYLEHSIAWLDACNCGFSNFHLVFLMRLSRFLGLYPNLEDYSRGDYFDLMNACFTSVRPHTHAHYIKGEEAFSLTRLMRMNYDTMHIFGMSRTERARCLDIIGNYYKLHIPGFGELKSVEVLHELFD